MNIYNFNKNTLEFLTQSKAKENPLKKGTFLIPSFATTKEPLAKKVAFAICFNLGLNKWEYKEDFRTKKIHNINTKKNLDCDYLGVLKLEHKLGDYVKTQAELNQEQEYQNKVIAKMVKKTELNDLKIHHNAIIYDANGESIGNMAAVIAIANATYNRAISIGITEVSSAPMTPAEAYQYVYKDTKIIWKGTDNKPHEVQIENIVETSRKAMVSKAKILFKYT